MSTLNQKGFPQYAIRDIHTEFRLQNNAEVEYLGDTKKCILNRWTVQSIIRGNKIKDAKGLGMFIGLGKDDVCVVARVKRHPNDTWDGCVSIGFDYALFSESRAEFEPNVNKTEAVKLIKGRRKWFFVPSRYYCCNRVVRPHVITNKINRAIDGIYSFYGPILNSHITRVLDEYNLQKTADMLALGQDEFDALHHYNRTHTWLVVLNNIKQRGYSARHTVYTPKIHGIPASVYNEIVNLTQVYSRERILVAVTKPEIARLIARSAISDIHSLRKDLLKATKRA